VYAVYTDLTEISFEIHVSCRTSCAFPAEENRGIFFCCGCPVHF